MKKAEANIKRVDNESSVLRKDLMSKTESQRLFFSLPMVPPKLEPRHSRRYVE